MCNLNVNVITEISVNLNVNVITDNKRFCKCDYFKCKWWLLTIRGSVNLNVNVITDNKRLWKFKCKGDYWQ